MKNLQCKLTRKRWLEIGVSALLFVLIIAWALVLEYTEPDREATAARKRFFAVARVTDILDDNAETQDWTEGRRIGQQYLEVEILNGPWKGETLEAINYLTIYTNVDAKIGTKIVVRLDLDDEGAPYIISIPNYNRAPVLLGLLAIFAALLLLIGRKKGLTALLGLVYTLACVWFIQVPMILRGAQPVVVTVVLVALTTAASLLFLNGFSRKTLCATLGCIGGVAVAGIFAALCGSISPLNGFNLPEAEELVLRASDRGLKISGLFFSGILRKHVPLIAISLLITFLYGGLVWNMFPQFAKATTSWEGHLSGAIAGTLCAIGFMEYGPPCLRRFEPQYAPAVPDL